MAKKNNRKAEKPIEEVEVIEGNAVADALSTLMRSVKDEAESKGEQPCMMALVAVEKGVHISFDGKGEDLVAMIASSMLNNDFVKAIIQNAAMVFSMREQQLVKQATESKPQTEA